MKLSYREAQRIFQGLRRIDESDDTKLDGETRLKVGININRLIPSLRTYEKEITRIQSKLMNGGLPVDQRKSIEADEELQRLGDALEDFKMKKFKIAELKLNENSKIKSETLSQIGPLIVDFDDGSFDE
jgi:hypothetical protein